MADIVNLRMARKRAARAGREREAEANRAAHSVPARERKVAEAELKLTMRRLEGHRRDDETER